MINTLYAISPIGLNGLTRIEGEEQRLLCAECSAPLSRTAPLRVEVQESRFPDTPLNVIWPGIGMIRKDLLEYLNPFGPQLLTLGEVIRFDGQLDRDWFTLVGLHRIVVRGTRKARVRRCSTCGQILYYCEDPSYLCPSPPTKIKIFDADVGTLVVDEQLAERINTAMAVGKWQLLGLKKLSTRTESLDGLPINLVDGLRNFE